VFSGAKNALIFWGSTPYQHFFSVSNHMEFGNGSLSKTMTLLGHYGI
jgi:hypothetical protein